MKKEELKDVRELLIVVDMLNGFIKEGVLHDERISKIIPRVVEIIEDNINKGGLTLFIKDTHNKNSTEFKRFGNTSHCLKGTQEAELVDEIKNFENMNNVISIEKNSTSYMEAPKFRELIKLLDNLTRVIVVGCCTDICDFNGIMGLANYFDEWNKNVDIEIYQDAVATYSEDERKKYVDAANLLMEQQGIKLIKNYKGDK